MKKNDFIIVAILIALMFAWMNYYPELERRFFPRPERVEEERTPAPPAVPETPPMSVETPAIAAPPVLEKEPAGVPPSSPEKRMQLGNDHIELEISSHGGAVVSATLKNYPAENRRDSGPVILDFEYAPALRYDGLPVSAGDLKEISNGLRYSAQLGSGFVFERTLRLDGEYLLVIEDSFVNQDGNGRLLPALRLPTGPMSNPEGTGAMKGVQTLGVDTFSAAEGVRHWGREFHKLFRNISSAADWLTTTPSMIAPRPVDWAAAKNKFFVQIVRPEGGAAGFDLSVRQEGEGRRAVAVETAAALQFAPEPVESGETFTRETRVYIGPKDYNILKTLGMAQSEVMEFKSTGFWKFMNPIMYPLRTGLLWSLNALYRVVRNYGVAIMLLTVLVRIIFWPITHKGTESMRRMQALQPQLKALQEKYKDNPQRMQKEVMNFYKENKVNPMGGCLPMFVQIPVFIALFTVLRSAIELRFSRFLWVSDLSEPENLFAGTIPFVGSLNILPILMAVTMMWQQKLTPTAGDPQQQKMMAIIMPGMMLVFFYTMPSGLVLYWTTSQVLMIAQMLYKKTKKA